MGCRTREVSCHGDVIRLCGVGDGGGGVGSIDNSDTSLNFTGFV